MLTFNTILIIFMSYLEAGDNLKWYPLYFQHALENYRGQNVHQVGIAAQSQPTAENVRRNTKLTCRKPVNLFQKKVW